MAKKQAKIGDFVENIKKLTLLGVSIKLDLSQVDFSRLSHEDAEYIEFLTKIATAM